MHVCFCVSWYFPQSIGGTETYVHTLALFLQRQCHRVTVLKPGKNEESYTYEGVEVESFFPGSVFSKRMYLGLQCPDLKDFEKKLKSLRPDVIHFHSLTGPAGISIFHVNKARELVRKVYFTFHLPHLTCATSTFKYLKKYDCDGVAEQQKCAACLFAHSGWPIPAAKLLGGFSNLLSEGNVRVLGHNAIMTRLGGSEWVTLRKTQLERLTYLCDKLICLSSWFHQVLKKNGVATEKIAFIEQGLFMKEQGVISKEKAPTKPSGPVRLVFLGRIDPIKGLPLLLSVIEEFTAEDLILDLYGPVEPKYLAQIKRHFEKRNLTYKGVLKREEILSTLSNYDAIVVPSTVTEMAPLVLQEAFAAGIPAIASNVAGNADFVKPGVNGWLFKSGSEVSLKEILLWLLKHKSELVTATTRMQPVRTIKNIGNEHLDLYLS